MKNSLDVRAENSNPFQFFNKIEALHVLQSQASNTTDDEGHFSRHHILLKL